MKRSVLTILVACGLGHASAGLAQQNAGLGRFEYHAKCAACHGPAGKGDGPAAKSLTKAPADLSTLARRNGGAFPKQLVWQTIDGRPRAIGAHGSREMPIWGQEYRDEINRTGHPTGPETFVAGRISALIDYLASIQVQ
jgi:mono/diheme cytochrome c family protein